MTGGVVSQFHQAVVAVTMTTPNPAHLIANFEARCSDPIHMCPQCSLPRIPYTVLSCGHAFCAPCANSVNTCPECAQAVVFRTRDLEMSERGLKLLVYHCAEPLHVAEGCTFVGSFTEAVRHDTVSDVDHPQARAAAERVEHSVADYHQGIDRQRHIRRRDELPRDGCEGNHEQTHGRSRGEGM
jgi:hypothetical protein